jgi:6-phosphofructokinase
MNSVIAAATIEAVNSGWQVFGIENGFEGLIEGSTQNVRELGIEDVSRIHSTGGSILYTSRANPTKTPEDLARTVATIASLKLDALLTIGGDDTGFSATRVAAEAGGQLLVAHVPKTIDNDLPLPYGIPTFGFETARHVGTEIVNNLMTDAMTTRRWYFVVAMGRQAGHLALGIGKAAGATITIIGEDFATDRPIALTHLVDLLESTIYKRIAHGRPFGVAILAEGLSLRLRPEDLEEAMPEADRDEHGHIRLAEVQLHRLLADLVKKRLNERGQKTTIVSKNIGYELRSAPPIPFDVDYTRDLGFCAVDYLRKQFDDNNRQESGAMVTVQDGKLVPLPFGTFNDPETGRPNIRYVDVTSESYRVAREYMIRLERADLQDPDLLTPIAAATGMTNEEFSKRFGYLADDRGGS